MSAQRRPRLVDDHQAAGGLPAVCNHGLGREVPAVRPEHQLPGARRPVREKARCLSIGNSSQQSEVPPFFSHRRFEVCAVLKQRFNITKIHFLPKTDFYRFLSQ